MRSLISLAMACLALLCSPAHAGPTQVRYWDWARTPKRDDYQFAVLRMALDKSVARYGAYQLTRVTADYSTLRSRQEVSDGANVNVQAGPWRELNPDDPSDRRIPVNIPIMSGLLGYRVLLIRKEDLAKFEAVRHADHLKTMTAGQGRGWAELGLYRRNGYKIVDSGNIDTLIPMLAGKRFDYLPMSVTEASSALSLYPELADTLTIAPNLMISYPLPTIFYVSARHPELARRIEYGLKQAIRDGALHELLIQYFDKEIARLADVTRHFRMSDPAVPKQLLSPMPSVRQVAGVAQ
jgi:hypothetical protein